jgi:hypothetical protein
MKFLRLINIKIKNNERGQAMLLIALAFIGLVAFIGLAIDAGILFAHLGHLRRGVDAAALSAANQIRQGYATPADLQNAVTSSAEQLILLNLPANSAGDLDVIVETCETAGHSIPDCGTGERKLARVQASLDVSLAFMPIVGFYEVKLNADAISEAASVDLVLVIDNSTSMAYDAGCHNGTDDDGENDGADDCEPEQYGWPGSPGPSTDPSWDLPDDYYRDTRVCNPLNKCQPFEKVREAAKILVNNMFEDYDQIALVTFNKHAGRITPVGSEGTVNEAPLHEADKHLTLDIDDAIAALDAMQVYPDIDSEVCEGWAPNPKACMRTNHSAGLMVAAREFEVYGYAREEAVKVVVLLSDGLSNAAYAMGNAPWDPPSPIAPVPFDNWFCPEAYWPSVEGRRPDGHAAPFCTDGDGGVGYDGVHNLTIGEDPDNMTRRMADYLACLPGDQEACGAGSGLGTVIFTIGLGDGVINFSSPLGTVPSETVGEDLLRYIARVGFDGDPELTPNSPCWVGDEFTGGPAPSGTSCGNYYYAPEGDDLIQIFEEIADRIFTRLTH